MMDIAMKWDKIKNNLITNKSDVSEERCPECGGNLRFSCDKLSGSYTIQCKQCWIMIRGH